MRTRSFLSVLSWCFLFFTLLFSTSHAATHYYDFVLKESNFTRLCSTKSMLTVNDSFPGPEIHVQKGDTAIVNVHNNGTYGVTIHWHGVKQPRNPWHDGPENITQCPIKPGTSFQQVIYFSTEEGTLWWHAHSDWSRATVHGAIIIHPKNQSSFPFPTPHAERTIVLGSWYKADVMDVINQATATGDDPNVSDAFTINGQPGDLYDCSNETTYKMVVEYGKTYLLRIINAILNEEMFFGIANHTLTLVGTDAAYVKPIISDYIMITPGQTMDVLFTANQTLSTYYIASYPFTDSTAPFDNTTTTAILEYKGNYTPPSSPSFPDLPLYNDTDKAAPFVSQIKSLANAEHPINVPKNVTRKIIISVAVNVLNCTTSSCSNDTRLAASLNNVSFATPTTDILQAYYYGIAGVYTTNFPEVPEFYNFTGDVSNVTRYTNRGTKVIMAEYGEAIEIVFQGTNLPVAENHPMHLHGFSFYLVGMDKGNFNSSTNPPYYNLVDPPEVNTIGLPNNGWAAVRFFADNPGVWFMHCHLERHASWGMATVLIVKNGTTADTTILPAPNDMPKCG